MVFMYVKYNLVIFSLILICLRISIDCEEVCDIYIFSTCEILSSFIRHMHLRTRNEKHTEVKLALPNKRNFHTYIKQTQLNVRSIKNILQTLIRIYKNIRYHRKTHPPWMIKRRKN